MSDSPIQDTHHINKEAATHLCFRYLEDGTPVFFLPYIPRYESAYKRIWGFRYEEPGIAAFPAYPPFGDLVLADLQKVFKNLTISEEATEEMVWNAHAKECAESGVLPENLADTEFAFPPYDHQLAGLVRAFWYPRTGLFFHPGLGKTKIMVDLLRLLRKDGEEIRTLVLCPSPNLVTTWLREIEKHGMGEIKALGLATASGGNITAARRKKLIKQHDWAETDVIVMSYGTMISDFQVVRNLDLNVVILDESHLLKTPKSKRTKHVLDLVRCHRRYELTGTPSQGDPRHLFGQLTVGAKFLTGGDAWRYTRRYCIQEPLFRCRKCQQIYPPLVEKVNGIDVFLEPKTCRKCRTEVAKEIKKKYPSDDDYGIYVEERDKALEEMPPASFSTINRVVGYKNLHVLKRIVEYFALRKRQEDCLDLPERWIEDVPYALDRDTKKLYNELISRGSTQLFSEQVKLAHKHVLITKLLQILSGFVMSKGFSLEDDDSGKKKMPWGDMGHLLKQPKIQVITDLLESILADPGNKVIMWAQFSEEINLLKQLLIKLKIGHVIVKGNTANRTAKQDEFNEDPDCRVYLSQMQTGIGVTLNAANYVIYAGWTYDLQAYQQSLERNYRLGQKRAVKVYRLYVPHSIHEFLMMILEYKESLGEAMTAHSPCGLCKHATSCMQAGIKPFTSDCKVCPDETTKPVTQPRLLP